LNFNFSGPLKIPASYLLRSRSSRGTYLTALAKPLALVKPFNSFRSDPPSTEDKDKVNGNKVAKKASKSQKKCFKCHDYGDFQAYYPDRRLLTVIEIEELDQTMVEKDEEESNEEAETSYLPLEEGEMLMIKRVIHATKVPPKARQREQIFHPRCKVAHKT